MMIRQEEREAMASMRSALESFVPEIELDEEQDVKQDALLSALRKRQMSGTVPQVESAWDHTYPTGHQREGAAEEAFTNGRNSEVSADNAAHFAAAAAQGSSLRLDPVSASILLKVHQDRGIRRQVTFGEGQAKSDLLAVLSSDMAPQISNPNVLVDSICWTGLSDVS